MLVLALRERPLGVAALPALPALFVVGVGILSPLAVAEALTGLRYGLPMDVGGLVLFGILAASFLIAAVVNLLALRSSTGVSSANAVRTRKAIGPRSGARPKSTGPRRSP